MTTEERNQAWAEIDRNLAEIVRRQAEATEQADRFWKEHPWRRQINQKETRLSLTLPATMRQ